MKIRSGFVSNSSSSSYIVSISISPAKFYALLYDEYNGWCIDELTEKIAEHIASDKNNVALMKKQEQKYITENCDTFREKWRIDKLEYLETESARLETIYNIIIADKDAMSVVSAILDYNHIKIEQEKNKIILVGNTSMHNSFQDMPKILTEIMSFFLFDTKYAVKCYRKGQYDEIVKTEVGDI